MKGSDAERVEARSLRRCTYPSRGLDPDVALPVQAHDDDAGYDLCSREDAHLVARGGRVLVPTGLAVAIPSGYAGLVLPAFGPGDEARRHGRERAGLIDAQYRGELKVLLVNTDPSEATTCIEVIGSRSS